MTVEDLKRELFENLRIDSENDDDGELMLTLRFGDTIIDRTWIIRAEVEEVLRS